MRAIVVKRMGQFNNQIRNRETKNFYVCERCNIEFNEENALLHSFTCDECGEIFTIKNNVQVLRELKRNWNKLNKELELIDKEIEIEGAKLDKKKLRDVKKEEKEKAKKREEARKKRLATRAKNLKEAGKLPATPLGVPRKIRGKKKSKKVIKRSVAKKKMKKVTKKTAKKKIKKVIKKKPTKKTPLGVYPKGTRPQKIRGRK